MRTFLDTLRDIRAGDAANELTDHLRELVAAVRASGRPGALTLTLKVKPASKGELTTLMVEDIVKITAPKPERGATILFADQDNTLVRSDPRQPRLPELREVKDHPTRKAVDNA
jgi:hypothetical protein